MKKKYLLLLLSCMLLCLLLSGCSSKDQTEIKALLTSELDKLKQLDAYTVKKYLSAEDFFPDSQHTAVDTDLAEQFLSLYFQDFSYKILKIDVKQEDADATLRLETIDAQALARDFAKETLKQSILSQVSSEGGITDNLKLLTSLLTSRNYKTAETNCSLHLHRKDDTWCIQRSSSLENDIVGGYISHINNPNLLTPSETLQIYLETIREMDTSMLASYLNLSDFSGDENSRELFDCLLEQINRHYSYKISHASSNGVNAKVDVSITAFDAKAILKTYEKNMEAYLDTPEALYDGEEGRQQKAFLLIKEAIKNNNATAATELSVSLTNNGYDWELQDTDKLANAICGFFPDAYAESRETPGGSLLPEVTGMDKASRSDRSSSPESSQPSYDSDESYDSSQDSSYDSDGEDVSDEASLYDSSQDSSYDSDDSYDSSY